MLGVGEGMHSIILSSNLSWLTYLDHYHHKCFLGYFSHYLGETEGLEMRKMTFPQVERGSGSILPCRIDACYGEHAGHMLF